MVSADTVGQLLEKMETKMIKYGCETVHVMKDGTATLCGVTCGPSVKTAAVSEVSVLAENQILCPECESKYIYKEMNPDSGS